MKRVGEYVKKISLIITLLCIFVCFSSANFLLTAHANTKIIAQLIPTVPPVLNGIVPTAVNTVTNLINNNISPIPTILPNPTGLLPSNNNTTTSTTGSTDHATTTSTTSSTNTSSTIPQNQNTQSIPVVANTTSGDSASGLAENDGTLFLTGQNTAKGKIVLTKDIMEVVFGPDSLSHNGILTFVMPAERNIIVLFNFSAFMTTDESGSQILLPQAIRMQQASMGDSASLTLPADEELVVSSDDCPDDVWDGKIEALGMLSPNTLTLRGDNIGIPVEVGRSDCRINLTREATIDFKNAADWQVGYRLQNQRQFTPITALCPAKDQPECYTTQANDLLVKTTHFTQFVTFKTTTWWDMLLAFVSNNNLGTLALAVILTIFLILILSNLSVLRKVGKIAEVDKQKSEYVSMASHELRTPLTAIKGFVSMLLGGDYGKVKDEMKKPLEEVQTSTQRSLNLINDMLDTSRIEAGKISLAFTTFPIDSLISEVASSLEPLAKDKGLMIATKHVDTTVVQADKEKTRQLLTNLLSNAIKYTDKGNITLSTRESHNLVSVFVTDTGGGIAKEDQKKLFSKFGRINTKPTGTGLGLYISRQLARKMGGDVWLEKSEEGVGSTFALALLRETAPLARKLAKKA